MCLPFFHRWSKWSAPEKVNWHPVDDVGNSLGPGYIRWRQVRTCSSCGKIVYRYVEKGI